MTHTVHAFLSVKGAEFDGAAFVSTHELEPDYHWLEGETKPWGTVNKHSGFQLTVFRGEARDFDDLFLGRYLEANEAWISELRQKGRAVDMSIDFLLDAHHSYSPYLDVKRQEVIS